MMTYYVVQAFERGARGALIADMPVQATDEGHARRLADRLARAKAGVIAFSRAGDLSSGEFEDAKILVAVGQIPTMDGETVEAEDEERAIA
jgi:hypothetical protein